jgi:hypothetical protein
MRLGHLLSLFVLTLSACTRPAQPSRDQDAAAKLAALPAIRGDQYRTMQDLKAWRNPYLIIRADGVGLLDVSSHEEHRLKLEELPDALASLPLSAWPYGRVVALQEASPQTTGDTSRIKDNRGKVAAALHSLQIVINYVPAA